MAVGFEQIVAIIRFTMLLSVAGLFVQVYRKLKFRGFVTLIIGVLTSAVTLALVETGIITATDTRYEILLFIVSTMYLISAWLIYRALKDFHIENSQKSSSYSTR